MMKARAPHRKMSLPLLKEKRLASLRWIIRFSKYIKVVLYDLRLLYLLGHVSKFLREYFVLTRISLQQLQQLRFFLACSGSSLLNKERKSSTSAQKEETKSERYAIRHPPRRRQRYEHDDEKAKREAEEAFRERKRVRIPATATALHHI
jgi:hypothetical protein